MGKYLHHYSDFDDLRINYINDGPETVYCEPWVSYTEENKSITLSNGKTYKLKGMTIAWDNSLNPVGLNF